MASFEDLMIGFNDNGYNTVDSFVDRTKELPTKMFRSMRLISTH